MAKINVSRVVLGGIVAAALIWVIEGAASTIFSEQMRAAAEAHNIPMEMTAAKWAITVISCLLLGLVMLFLYASVRTHFGPGPRTAVIVALAVWCGSTVVSLLGYGLMSLFSTSLLVFYAIIGLVELILGCLAGARLYKE